jgi:Tfp pilus assembly protein PilX
MMLRRARTHRQAATAPRRLRRGSALLLVLAAMVVLAVLSSAAMMASFQEARSSRAGQIQQRALSVAEFGLNTQLANWSQSRNALANGAIESSTIGVARGDSATVSIQRLTSRTYNVVSVGRAGIDNGLLEAQRQVSMLVTVSAPSIQPGGLLMSFGRVDIQGSPTVSGRNTTPPGWPTCTSSAGDTVAVSFNSANGISVQKPSTQAIGGTRADPRAADPLTYSQFGSESWASLVARANVRITGSASPSPSGNSTQCFASNSNWGEPSRGAGTTIGCYNYFPVIHSSGDLSLSNGRGQGVLIVDGALRMTGNFSFVGLILVRDEIEIMGNMSLHGAMMSRNADGVESRIRGNASLTYSSCAVSQALSGLATPMRTRQRSWANVY